MPALHSLLGIEAETRSRSELASRGAPVPRGAADPGQLRAPARRRGHGRRGHVSSCPQQRVLATFTRAARHRRRAGPPCPAAVTRARRRGRGAVPAARGGGGRRASIPSATQTAIVQICRASRRHPARHRARRGEDAVAAPAEIADRLDDMFRLLTGGRRARRAPPDATGDPRVVLRHAQRRRASGARPVGRSSPDRSPSTRPRPSPAGLIAVRARSCRHHSTAWWHGRSWCPSTRRRRLGFGCSSLSVSWPPRSWRPSGESGPPRRSAHGLVPRTDGPSR